MTAITDQNLVSFVFILKRRVRNFITTLKWDSLPWYVPSIIVPPSSLNRFRASSGLESRGKCSRSAGRELLLHLERPWLSSRRLLRSACCPE